MPYNVHTKPPFSKHIMSISSLPPACNLETVPVYRQLNSASRLLAELKGLTNLIPNSSILIGTLPWREAKASSEIENIATTYQDILRTGSRPTDAVSPEAREVALYREALMRGYGLMQQQGKVIANNTIIEMFRTLKQTTDGFRTTPGTKIVNRHGATIHTPPQYPAEVKRHMHELEKFINDDDLCDLDPLVKMAIIHHQFESIHPFSDGNGRIGRILNVLYLLRCGLLEHPVLYLSGQIIKTKSEYYRLLQEVRTNNSWPEWVVYMLKAVAAAAAAEISLVRDIHELMMDTKQKMRRSLPKIYSHDLINTLFRNPYARIEYLAEALQVSRQTSAKYLNALAEHKFVRKLKAGRIRYFINDRLVELLMRE